MPLRPLLVALFLSLLHGMAAAQSGTGTFVHISDFHFDPFASRERASALAGKPIAEWPAWFAADPDPRLSPWGRDTNHALLTSALADLSRTAADADFVLVTGDMLAHRFPWMTARLLGYAEGSAPSREFAVRTLRFVAERLRAAVPDKPVFLTLGNVDAGCGDYRIDPGGPFLADTVDTVRALAAPAVLAEDFERTYRAGGYYAAAHPTLQDTTILVLDNALWSFWYRNQCGTGGLEGGEAMLAWLDQQLSAAQAAGRRVWLVQHIPSGFDPYATLHGHGGRSCETSIVPMLAEPFAARYLALQRRFAGAIAASFAGHTHHDEYRLLHDGSGTAVAVEKVAPGITPLFGQNPGYHVFTYDRGSGELTDFSTRYLADLGTAASAAEARWEEEYIFSRAYGVAGYSAAAVETVLRRLSAEGAADTLYRRLYNVGRGELPAKGLDAYRCAIAHLDPAGFAACLCGR